MCFQVSSVLRVMGQKKERKPWGKGPASVLKEQRREKAEQLASWLYPALDLVKVECTGMLFSRGNYRRKTCQALFKGWIGRTEGSRYFTRPVIRTTVRYLLRRLPFIPPRDPKSSHKDYVELQASRFEKLARAAKKHNWAGAHPPATKMSEKVRQLIQVRIDDSVCI